MCQMFLYCGHLQFHGIIVIKYHVESAHEVIDRRSDGHFIAEMILADTKY